MGSIFLTVVGTESDPEYVKQKVVNQTE